MSDSTYTKFKGSWMRITPYTMKTLCLKWLQQNYSYNSLERIPNISQLAEYHILYSMSFESRHSGFSNGVLHICIEALIKKI